MVCEERWTGLGARCWAGEDSNLFRGLLNTLGSIFAFIVKLCFFFALIEIETVKLEK